MISLRQLEVLDRVLALGGFRRAAEDLGISQVAISEHVVALESATGAVLFDRVPGSAARPTAKAWAIAPRIGELLDELHALVHDVDRPADRLVVDPQLVPGLRRALDEAADGPGGVAIEARREDADVLRRRIRRGELDAAIAFTDRTAVEPVARTEPLAVFVGPAHPWAAGATVSPADLATRPRVAAPHDDPVERLTVAALAAAGTPRTDVAVATIEVGLLIETLAASDAWACTFAGILDTVPGARSRLAPVRLEVPVGALEARVISRPRDELFAATTRLIDAVSAP